MTSPAEGELTVDLRGRWVDLPVTSDDDPDRWADDMVAAVLDAAGGQELPEIRRLYGQAWAGVVRDLRGRDVDEGSALVAAYGLLDRDELLPATVAEVYLASNAGGTVDGVVDALVVPEDQRFGPPVVEPLSSPAGEATWVRQTLVTTDPDGSERAQASSVVVWDGPQAETVVLMTCYFDSAIDAETCREEVRALAATVGFATAP